MNGYIVAVAFLSSILFSFLQDQVFKYKSSRSELPLIAVLNVILTACLVSTFDDFTLIIKGFLYIQVLIFVAIYDYRTKTIPDFVHPIILCIGLINFPGFVSLWGLLLVPMPYFIAALLTDGVGGGDIKFMAASGFLLGFYAGFVASLIALILALVISVLKILTKRMDKHVSFALGPYLSMGCFIMFMLNNFIKY